MNLRMLSTIPPWQWPEEAGEFLLEVLTDEGTSQADLLLAAELAGEYVVIDDALSRSLLALVRDGERAPEIRARAALSLGPVLEEMDIEADASDDPDDLPIAVATFDSINETLHALYADPSVPAAVRRGILEASVRAPQEWHADAVRRAYADSDPDWRRSAVACMCFVGGFEAQILAAMNDPELEYAAVVAAGNWGLDDAWERVAALVEEPTADRDLLFAAIEAVANIRPGEAADLLDDLTDCDDEEIAAAAAEALGIAAGFTGDDFDADIEDDDD